MSFGVNIKSNLLGQIKKSRFFTVLTGEIRENLIRDNSLAHIVSLKKTGEYPLANTETFVIILLELDPVEKENNHTMSLIGSFSWSLHIQSSLY